jgi:hypothetical protein
MHQLPEVYPLPSNSMSSSRGKGLLPNVLVVGEAWRREFQHILESVSSSSLTAVASDSTAAQAVLSSQEKYPDLVLYFHGGGGPGELLQLRQVLDRLNPLSPLMVVLGSWNEGASRHGPWLTGTLYIPWHQWGAFWHHFLKAFRTRGSPVISLAPCISLEEYVLFHESQFLSQMDRNRDGARATSDSLATIVTPSCESWRFLATLLIARGLHPRWERYPSLAGTSLSNTPCGKVVILDLLQEPENTRPVIEWARTRMPRPRIIVLQCFPRVCEMEMLKSWGADAVLGKPVDLMYLDDVLCSLKLSPLFQNTEKVEP